MSNSFFTNIDSKPQRVEVSSYSLQYSFERLQKVSGKWQLQFMYQQVIFLKESKLETLHFLVLHQVFHTPLLYLVLILFKDPREWSTLTYSNYMLFYSSYLLQVSIAIISWGAICHPYFSFLPVNFQIVFFEPEEPQYQVLFVQTGNYKQHLL